MISFKPPKILYLLALTIAAFLLWSFWFDIDQTVRAQGQFVPGARTQIIQAADGGVLSALLVQEGDIVMAGQVLAVLEPERAQAAYDESRAKFISLRAGLIRVQAESAGHAPVFGTEFKNYPELVAAQEKLSRQRRQNLEDGLTVLREAVAMANDELKMNENLFATGDNSKLELLRAKRQVADVQARIGELRNKFMQEARTEAVRQEEELSSQRYRQADRLNVLEHTKLTSPTEGIVKFLRINTVGGVMRAGDEIMQISPTDGELFLEVRINPTDIGQLRLGLPVSVRLDAFDYTQYGSLSGELTYLSSDTLSEQGANGQSQIYYRGRVRVGSQLSSAKASLNPIAIKPGMTATVDIRIGQRSVISYLFKPIARSMSGAMTER